ncbi:MAG: HDIG domain-containing protein [bacterium]|nr:HDIG domain-containing protein [bacterium]
MKPVEVIDKYYKKGSISRRFLVEHSKSVAKKALEVAKNVPEMKPDLRFIEEASMLHDIGIFLTNAPVIGCSGDKEYICHGYLGRKILEKEGYPKHGLVCERHLGVGISLEEIEVRNLPLPKRNMLPISLEEEIICFADKFFSKGEGLLKKEKSLEDIRKRLPDFGNSQEIFEGWMVKFKCN